MSGSIKFSCFAEKALLPDGWARDVLIGIDDDGKIASLKRGAASGEAERLSGPVVPALADLHSHAFQRAMAGLTDMAAGGDDSFWTWREKMYDLVSRLAPEDVEAIATVLRDPGADVDDRLEAARAAEHLRELPPDQARAVLLAVVAGNTAQEVARHEGIPLGTAKTRIRTGLARMRRALEGES